MFPLTKKKKNMDRLKLLKTGSHLSTLMRVPPDSLQWELAKRRSQLHSDGCNLTTIHTVVMFNSNIFSLQGVWGKKNLHSYLTGL